MEHGADPLTEPSIEPDRDEATEASGWGDRLSTVAPWIAALLGGVGGIGALEYLRGRYQHNSVFTPDDEPSGGWVPSDSIDVEDVWFEAPDGQKLHGWWIGRPKAAGTVLYCHGSSGSIAHRVGVFRELSAARMNVFAFDYRGYGQSTGTPNERGLYTDARAAYDHLVGPLGRSPEEIILFGHSLGGAVAIDAALDRSVAGLVVESSFTDIKDMARTLHPQIPLHLIARNGFRSIEKVGELTLPKLFIHGTDDETVPFEIGRRLYEAAAEPKELYVVEGAGHNDVHQQGGAAYRRRLARFRRHCLK
jgi:fermentation-respiration switch protein FrsA (DUF1100 family)